MDKETLDALTDKLKTGQWKTCFNCNGAGQVSIQSQGDFLGAGECPACGGQGMVFEYANGSTVMYPGGPFVG